MISVSLKVKIFTLTARDDDHDYLAIATMAIQPELDEVRMDLFCTSTQRAHIIEVNYTWTDSSLRLIYLSILLIHPPVIITRLVLYFGQPTRSFCSSLSRPVPRN